MLRIESFVFAWLLLASSVLPSVVFGAGEESVGNEKLSEANYGDWPKVMPVINAENRVYRSWVNGNERFYFLGSTADLNKALAKFAKIEADRRVVVLRPGPATGKSFGGDHVFEYNYQLHLLGGIAKHMATRDLGNNIWDPNPYMHVYVGGDIKLEDLKIPKGVDVVEIADLQSRYAISFGSRDQSVRGWACGELVRLNEYDAKSLERIAKMLDDPESWVGLNAAGALSQFTNSADAALKKLQSVKTDDERLKERIDASIEELKAAKADAKAEKTFRETLDAIHEFVMEQMIVEQRKK